MDFYKEHQKKIEKKNGPDETPQTSHTEEVPEKKPELPEFKNDGSWQNSYLRKVLFRATGNFLVLFSLYALGWVFWEPMLAEIQYTYESVIGREYVVVEESDPSFSLGEGNAKKGLLSDVLSGRTATPLVPVDPNFSIVIPKLGANSNVITNVSTANEDEYLDALQNGVAHALGTALPGEGRHVYLFAHSTNTFSNVSRYNAIFYLLYKLENEDEIDIFYNGIRHRYRVTGKTIVDPSEVQYLTRQTDSEFLTLQTCWPPGTIAKRMLVFAEPIR